MDPHIDRQPHAVLDLPSRRQKGVKIERILELAGRNGVIRMLEVGTGSGGIAHYFGTHESLKCRVDAVDVADNRQVSDGYRYTRVTSTALPFDDASFDVVLTNHVIEHVGDLQAQRHHLREVKRVLAPDGVAYLAVPNRWMLVEPHYKLAFLSWLPSRMRSSYLRLSGKGVIYDCEPLTLSALEDLLRSEGFEFRNCCVEALRETLDIEQRDSWMGRLVRVVPDAWLRFLAPIIPTLIYRLRLR